MLRPFTCNALATCTQVPRTYILADVGVPKLVIQADPTCSRRQYLLGLDLAFGRCALERFILQVVAMQEVG